MIENQPIDTKQEQYNCNDLFRNDSTLQEVRIKRGTC
ncbi:MAG: hypothetical protein CEN91_467 [Candidatus Berkelbacteria bacterium Licking1014_85]|uniref:Uncharacterized protein n=1 Tax=Candidatus Berkelbacteria bacterium Licking1014_85 TaxID=2017148 RepID=A0A554LHQ7_9BACT|nr:MAG: hypothetical protein CEN91_467 [Candidatus Berkelbacteria bacterium Licking1014_85]